MSDHEEFDSIDEAVAARTYTYTFSRPGMGPAIPADGWPEEFDAEAVEEALAVLRGEMP